jgi:DMSO/TMAO reductase YedYZ heme-binding membrane subunit
MPGHERKRHPLHQASDSGQRLVPLALLIWDQAHKQLGANPQNFLILTTGMMTLIFLVLTMAVTPVRKITGWNWLIQFRRMLGLYAFFYGCLHFCVSSVSTGDSAFPAR